MSSDRVIKSGDIVHSHVKSQSGIPIPLETLALIERGRAVNAILRPTANQYKFAILLGRLCSGRKPYNHSI